MKAEFPPRGGGGGGVRARASSRVEQGALFEARAAALLVTHGYKVVLRNVRPGTGELDIVAYDKETLCFVEVKQRASGAGFGGAAGALTHRKKGHLRRAAAAFVRGMRPLPRCRFDVVLFDGASAQLIVDAFR